MSPDQKELGLHLKLEFAKRQAIVGKTKCSASVRERQNKERALTASGPLSKLEEAHKMAIEAIEKNKLKVELYTAVQSSSGGKGPAGGIDATFVAEAELLHESPEVPYF